MIYGGVDLPMRRFLAAAAATVLAVTTGVASANAAPRAAHHSSTTASPSGQTTLNGVLTGAAATFSNAQTGWSSYAGTTVRQLSSVGHNAAGALSVQSAGPWTGATSPRFAVTPGMRYAATSWVRAQTVGHSVGMALRFYDRNGALIKAGTQIGQGLADSFSSWSPTMPVLGFAPAGAVSADVTFVDYDGPAGDVQLVDDVNVSQTSGSVAPVDAPLHTHGNQVLDRNGHPVTLHGIDLDGLQDTTWALISANDVRAAHAWGANLVRIPLSQDFALANGCRDDSDRYLQRVDALVDVATALHMVTLLDLHTLAVTPCTQPTMQPMPNQDSLAFWRLLANRYKNNPLVAFDLYNEPRDVTDKVWRDGGPVTSGSVTYVTPGMQALYNTVRGTGAKNLVVASGNNWANDYPAQAPLTGTRDLVYGVHAYTCPQGTPAMGQRCYPGPNGIYDPNGVLDRWSAIGALVPVMVSEFGFPDQNDGRYIANVASSVAARGWVGWSVFAFTGDTTGLWNLQKDTGPVFDPTASGMAVMNAMRAG